MAIFLPFEMTCKNVTNIVSFNTRTFAYKLKCLSFTLEIRTQWKSNDKSGLSETNR